MQNLGEEIIGEYLKIINECEFVQYNLQISETQGEIDVVGINIKKNTVYICESAVHLETGLQYTNNKSPNNVERFLNKFRKNLNYAEKYFVDYKKNYMLWTPIIRIPKKLNAMHNQYNDIQEIKNTLLLENNIELELIYNESYLKCLMELRDVSSSITKELMSPVLRLYQIEEKLKKHISKLPKINVNLQTGLKNEY